MAVAEISRTDKRDLIRRVGKDLIERNGKKKFYSPSEIDGSLRRLNERHDMYCWAYCFFATPADFNAYHERIGESCDYVSMKADLLAGFTDGASDSWSDVNLSWLDWPDFDPSGIFDFFDVS